MIKIILSPEQVQGMLDSLNVIPMHHYICLYKTNENITIQDLGKDGKENGETFELCKLRI